MSAEALLQKVPSIQNMLNLIGYIRIQAEKKIDGRYELMSNSSHIARLLERDGDSYLTRTCLNYIVYGKSVAYKARTIKAALSDADGKPIYDYKDNAVSGIHVLDRHLWEVDERTEDGTLAGVYINRDPGIGNWNYLKRSQIIYVTDWNPESRPMRSIGYMIQNNLEDAAMILGIDNELLVNSPLILSNRKRILVERLMHDTIIPMASKFVKALEDDLGLSEDMRLILNAGDQEKWVRAWDNKLAQSPEDTIIYV